MAQENKTFMIEGGRLIFRNFAGREQQYNPEGNRNFSVILDDELAQQLLDDGWNVKYLDPLEEGDPPVPHIQITVGYKIRPPRVVMMTSRARTNLGEHEVEVLDWADIANADLIARGYDWYVNGKGGTKAYLQSLFVTIEEDALEQKYAINEIEE